MKKKQNLSSDAKSSLEFENTFLPGLAIDSVIFGFHDNKLKILLLEYHDTSLLALPGGFIRKDEDLNAAATRILFERTGLKNIFLEQFYIFGDLARHDPKPLQTIMRSNGLKGDTDHWLLRRFATVGYYALVDFTKAVPIPDALSNKCAWYDLNKLPPLILDHRAIVKKALETLRANLDRKLIGFNLMTNTFTMSDLQNLYETVLGEKIRRTSFQRKILNLEIVEVVDKKWTGGAHKAPYLYRFRKKNRGKYLK